MSRSLLSFFTFLLIALNAFSQRVDPTFQPKLFAYGSVFGTTPLPDGKAIVTGDFDFVNGVQVGGIVRLNADGSVDGTFKTGIGAEGGNYVQSVARYADGKLLVFGTFSRFNGKDVVGIVRLNADGTFDNTFTSSFTGDVSLFNAGIQSTGKIVVTGVTVGTGSKFTYFITRLNADGSKDNTFQASLPPDNNLGNQRMGPIKILSNDKILAGGYFSGFGGVATANNLVRLNADGTLDNTFNANLSGDLNNSVAYIEVLPDGKMFIGRNIKLTKLNSDGSPDNSFAPTEPVTGFFTMVVLSDGSVVVAQQTVLRKYGPTGALLTDVSIDKFAGSVYSLGNDKLFTGFRDATKSHNARNASLAIDNSWTPVMVVTQQTEYNLIGGYSVVRQGEKFLVRTYSDFYTNGSLNDFLHPVDDIFRLNSDFTFDDTFHYTPTEYADAKILYVDGAGKIYVQQTRATVRAIERLNADGTDDNTFTRVTGLSFNDVADIGGGNLVAAEWDYNTSTGHLKKFNTSGIVDNSLNVSTVGQIQTIDVTSDGKWYITLTEWNIGGGLKVNGTTVKGLARLNSDGSLDGSFNPSLWFLDVKKIALQDNKPVVAGNIVKTQGGPTVAIERWTTTGTTDLQQGDGLKFPGHDFFVKGDYFYVITYSGQKFEVKRAKLNGEIDKLFAPVNYRNAESNQISSANPDRIFSLSDNSIIVIGNGTYKIDIVAPANAPSALAATVAATAEVSLTWTDGGPDEAVFELDRAEGSGAFTLLATLDANTTTYKDNTAADGKSYRYRVRAVNAGGATGYSNVAETGLITGLTEPGINFSCYPNPVTDYVHIQSSGVVNAFTLRQLDGRLLESSSPSSNEFKINMTNYSSGLYLLQLDGVNRRKTIKIFKQ